MKECPNCINEIHDRATVCMYCKSPVVVEWKHQTGEYQGKVLLAIALGVFIVICIGSCIANI